MGGGWMRRFLRGRRNLGVEKMKLECLLVSRIRYQYIRWLVRKTLQKRCHQHNGARNVRSKI
jgi:hypothetical protein